jgi:hypothetical protein
MWDVFVRERDLRIPVNRHMKIEQVDVDVEQSTRCKLEILISLVAFRYL